MSALPPPRRLAVALALGAACLLFSVRPAGAETAASGSASTLAASGSWTLVVGAVAIFGALLLLALELARPRVRRRHLAAEVNGAPRGAARAHLAELGTQTAALVDRALERHGRERALNDSLDRAGMNMRPAEFVVMSVAIVATSAFLGLVFGGLLAGLLLGLVAVVVLRSVLSIRTSRRRKKFADQLADSLSLLSGSLRSGHSIPQAIDALVQESDSPTSEEFRRVLFETRLGHPLPDALRALAHRVESEDFEWVVQAIEIQHTVGGDLANLIDNVMRTIRDRNRVRRQIDTLTAEGRLSAVILFCLPLVMFPFLLLVNPKYVDELLTTTAGNVMLAIGGVLLIVGGIWLRRIVRLRY
jgi:tight adherence protein B